MKSMRVKGACVSDPAEFISCPGEQYMIEYSSRVRPDGIIELEESGKIDIKQMINAQREQTDIAYIVNAIKNGDESMLNKNGFFGDMTSMPKTFAEVLQLQIDAEKSFYDLSTEVRQKFDNDFNQYFATAGTMEWCEKLGLVKDQEAIKEVQTDDAP